MPASPEEKLILIGALAKRTRCKIETIRYYEKIGVLAKPVRTEGGHRLYGARQVQRLTFVRRARGLGFTLEEVRALLRLAEGGERACSDIRAVAATHLGEVKAKIADLRAMQKVLTILIAQCEAGDQRGCPLIETLEHDRA